MVMLTAVEQKNIHQLVAGIFNAAPGAAYLQDLAEAYVALGRDWSALAQALGQTSAFAQYYPETLSVSEYIDQFLGALGLADVQDARDWLAQHAQAGQAPALLMTQALIALEASTDPLYADARQLLAHKAAVAQQYSVAQGQSAFALDSLQAVLAKVNLQSDVSTAAARESLITAGLAELAQQRPAVVVIDSRDYSHTVSDLQAGQEVLIAGKNHQEQSGTRTQVIHGDIAIEAAKLSHLKITLDQVNVQAGQNRWFSDTWIHSLVVGPSTHDARDLSEVRTLELSGGGTGNYHLIDSLVADGVNQLRFSGKGTLDVRVSIMDSRGAVIDGGDLQGSLRLSLSESVVAQLQQAATSTAVRLTGTQGNDDWLELYGGSTLAAPLEVSGFERISFYDKAKFDAAKVEGVKLFKSVYGAELLLTHLADKVKVLGPDGEEWTDWSDSAGKDQGFVAARPDGETELTYALSNGKGLKLQTDGFRSLVLDVKNDSFGDGVLAPALHRVQTIDLTSQTYDRVADQWLTGVDTRDIAAGAAVPLNHLSQVKLQQITVRSQSDTKPTLTAEGEMIAANLGTLPSTVKLLDVSGYAGQLTATLGARATAKVGAVQYDTGDVLVKVGAYGMVMTDDHSAARITTFEFTRDVAGDAAQYETFQWQISGFQTAQKNAAGTLDNATLLDVSALGVKSLADLVLSQQGNDLHVSAKAEGSHFEIVLTGVKQTQLLADNFEFA